MGGDLGPLFVARPQLHLLWLMGVAAVSLAAASALAALIRGKVSREFGLFGLAVVPGFALLVANLDLVEHSKDVRFCGSCHGPMAPLVAAVVSPNETLASIHYQSGAVPSSTACFTCHSGYGLAGDVEAKLSGLGHMWHELRGSYTYPLAMKGPFDIGSCLECHLHAPSFQAVPSHMDPAVQKDLVSHVLSCTGSCHPAAHPLEALNGSGSKP